MALNERLGPDPSGGALNKRLGVSTADELPGLLQARDAAAVQDTPSSFDVLKSPETLIKLGLTVAGLLSGDKNIAAGAAGLGMGALNQVATYPTEAAQSKAKQIDALDKQIEQKQKRLTDIATTKPELLTQTDEEGNIESVIQPQVLGDLLGLGVPVDPAAVVRTATMTNDRKSQYDLASKMLTLGQQESNPIMIRYGLSILNKAGNLGWTDEEIRGLSDVDPTDMLTSLEKIVSSSSLLEAVKAATAQRLPLTSGNIIAMLTAKDPAAESANASMEDKIKAQAYELIYWFQNEWANETQPGANGEAGVPNRALLNRDPVAAFDVAFKGREADVAVIKRVFGDHYGQSDRLDEVAIGALMKAVADLDGLKVFVDGIGGLDQGPMSPQEQQRQLSRFIEMSNQYRTLFNLGSGTISISNLTKVGNTYIGALNRMQKDPASRITGDDNIEIQSAHLTSRAHLIANASGYPALDSEPQAVREYFMQVAMRDYAQRRYMTYKAPPNVTAPDGLPALTDYIPQE